MMGNDQYHTSKLTLINLHNNFYYEQKCILTMDRYI